MSTSFGSLTSHTSRVWRYLSPMRRASDRPICTLRGFTRLPLQFRMLFQEVLVRGKLGFPLRRQRIMIRADMLDRVGEPRLPLLQIRLGAGKSSELVMQNLQIGNNRHFSYLS